MESPVDADSQHRNGPRKILVADDERLIADTLAIILRQAGFETAAVYDGQEAVEKARSWQPDLLLSDVMMPELNGIEAALQIRMWIPECKVLLFSGQSTTAGLLDDARFKGHHFEILDKPIHPGELIARLRKL
jgi:CheY-like chemotaxis protein